MIDEADAKLAANERLKLTAAYINAGAGTLFGAGVVAPLAAAVFGVVRVDAHLDAGAGGRRRDFPRGQRPPPPDRQTRPREA